MNHQVRVVAFVCTLAVGGLASLGADSILASKHNLSVSGPGTVRSTTENQVCIFCHAPHNSSADAPLWNRYSSGAVYTSYTSSTAKASPGQPTGSSKLCLSCHDGTVAPGTVRNRATEIPVAGARLMPSGPTRIGTDLADDHPVSFVYDESLRVRRGDLASPALLAGSVKLDSTGSLQCTTCHDPHDNRYGSFLVEPATGSALCSTCHLPLGWGGSIHSTSVATWDGVGTNPWPAPSGTTVADHGCASCHVSHAAGTPQRLLAGSTSEATCLACHNGHVAAGNIAADLGKTSAHPVPATEVHDPGEDLVNPPRHAECVDCHSPHQAVAQEATGPGRASGALRGVAGVSAAGAPVAQVAYTYELCFRCHGDSLSRGPARVTRQVTQTDMRLAFATTNASYHPVVAPGKGTNVPSLIAPWTTASIVSCTDCHGSNSSKTAGGTGPNGPHGSTNSPILVASGSALCYKCHSSSVVSGEGPHNSGHRSVACSVCHDPHGVAGTTRLVNFDASQVRASSGGVLSWTPTTPGHGTCSLYCHENHSARTY